MVTALKQPVALITGAAKRMGAVMAEHLHQAGFRVVVHCHQSRQQAQDLVDRLNQLRSASAAMVSLDLCQPKAAVELIMQVVKTFGQLDLLVNNASVFSRHDVDWAEMFLCNVQAPYQLSQAALSYLAKTQGLIVNITDVHAKIPLRGYAAYCQSKAALVMQTQALALEYAPKVRVNAIAPGAMLWPEGDNSLDADLQAQIIAKTALKRHGDPKHIVQALMYLVMNTFVTGQSLVVDGGRYLIA